MRSIIVGMIICGLSIVRVLTTSTLQIVLILFLKTQYSIQGCRLYELHTVLFPIFIASLIRYFDILSDSLVLSI